MTRSSCSSDCRWINMIRFFVLPSWIRLLAIDNRCSSSSRSSSSTRRLRVMYPLIFNCIIQCSGWSSASHNWHDRRASTTASTRVESLKVNELRAVDCFTLRHRTSSCCDRNRIRWVNSRPTYTVFAALLICEEVELLWGRGTRTRIERRVD